MQRVNLKQIIYISETPTPLSLPEVEAILEVSRKNNRHDGISGMLLYADNVFIQVIEGEESLVTALYQKVSKDPRHTAVTLVSDQAIKQRSFRNWSMGFSQISDPEILAELGLNDFFSGSEWVNSSRCDKIQELLKTFYNQQ